MSLNTELEVDEDSYEFAKNYYNEIMSKSKKQIIDEVLSKEFVAENKDLLNKISEIGLKNALTEKTKKFLMEYEKNKIMR